MQTSTKFILAVIVLAIAAYFIFNYRSTPTDVEQARVGDVNNSGNIVTNASSTQLKSVKNFTMTFTGYGPAGKVEVGTFDTKSFTYAGLSEGGLPQNAVATFDVRTVNTGKEGLNKHLCADDFFMCEKFPESKFVVTDVEQVPGTSYIFSGNLTFMGTEKSITFSANKIGEVFVGEFLLDITSFNFKYVGVDPKVLIKFSFEL